jgi:hypothetical protein
MNNEKQIILEMIGRPPIAFYRPLASIAGGATGGLFLSQLLYWNGKGDDTEGWIYKTGEEWQEETCLTRSEQECARKVLKQLCIVEEKKKGLPCRLHYRINFEKLFTLLSNIASKSTPPKASASLQKTTNKTAVNSKPVGRKQQASEQKIADSHAKSSTLYTETTPEITAEITTTTRKLEILEGSCSVDLIFPNLAHTETEHLKQLVRRLDKKHAQDILDEIEGNRRAGKIKTGSIPLAIKLVSELTKGTFQFSKGVAVRSARITEAKLIENNKESDERAMPPRDLKSNDCAVVRSINEMVRKNKQ